MTSATKRSHDLESEQAALGAALMEAEKVIPLFQDLRLRPTDFQEANHQAIYATMLSLHGAGKPIDIMTVTHETGIDTIELKAIMDACPTWAHAAHYAEQVIEASHKRQLSEFMALIAENAKSGQTSAEIIADIRKHLDSLTPPTGALAGIDARSLLNTEPPQADQIFSDAFDAGDKVAVIGSSKMRKSFFVLQAALCMAAARDFLTWTITKPRRVLLAQFEIKSEHFHRRVRNMAHATSINMEDIGDRLLIFNCRGITGETAIERIGAEAKKYRAEVIIFDPLYKLTTGDENAAKDMKPTLAAFDRLAEATGAAVVYVHHDAKGHAGDRDSRDRGAGSNIGRRDDDFCITITAHDVEESSVVIDCLWRNYPPRDPFTATWTERGCFEYMPDVPAVKKTSRSRSATTTARPEIETYIDAAMSLIARKPMAISLFREKIEAMAGMTQARQKRLVEIMLANGHLAEHHRRERGCHKAWIGTPEQIEGMKQIKLEV